MELNNKGFSLVELLVVITILTIISVVAYQNFGGATDKAITSRKVNDVSTIETTLIQYKDSNGQYPPVDLYNSTTNMWGYDTGSVANPSNTLYVSYNGQEISGINFGAGGGIVYGSGTLGQIGAKGTISMTTVGKAYLSKDLYDPELGDVKVSGSGTLIDRGIGRYIYAVYTKSKGNITWGTNNKGGDYYNIAYTVKKTGSDIYMTKIVGNYDEEACYDNKDNCPKTLIGSYDGNTLDPDQKYLVDKQDEGKTNSGSILLSFTSDKVNQGIPYPVKGFYTYTQWRDIPLTSCDNDDILIGGKIWAGCNSILGTTGLPSDVYNGNCYNYLGATTTYRCTTLYLTYTAKEKAFNSTRGVDNNIWGKLYLRANAVQTNNACPTGWHLPNDIEFKNLETDLNGGINCSGTSCSGLGWLGNQSKITSNNIVKALKIPLSGLWDRNYGNFNMLGSNAYLWSNEINSNRANAIVLYALNNVIFKNDYRKDNAFSVRCVKD
ncbi:MAG: FISUMP domain-containing protein [Candidatus Gracilibacteria bacterium]|nr:FISUMP domain-containing protein [Candidatus Gracilibacteria bacterium]